MKNLHNRVNKEELKERMKNNPEKRLTLSFYAYHHINDPQLFRDELYRDFSELNVYGRIYVAQEGINGQISIPQVNKDAFEELVNSIEFMKGIRLNYAIEDDGKSFYKLTIKVRHKIVADGLNDESFDVTDRGVHLDAMGFNQKAESDNTIIVDMRNHYESEVGHFKGAITPDVETFKESLPIIEDILSEHKEKDIVMYCTGGIRCEKASAYYKHRGFKNVFQLEGGIIEYARQVEKQGLENKFVGKNFVFDERMGERISEEVIAKCHQCGSSCDQHVNCANDACHILYIQCDECAQKFDSCCSKKCQSFSKLEEEEQSRLKSEGVEFNGTKFGKGRYKAIHRDEELDLG